MSAQLLTVRRFVVQPNHGNVYCHGTTTYNEDGTRGKTYGRAFHCPCGEALRDGDPCCLHGGRVVPIHVNCGKDKP